MPNMTDSTNINLDVITGIRIDASIALWSAELLKSTTEPLKRRGRTLDRLQAKLEALIEFLEPLFELADHETSMRESLVYLFHRCSQVCCKVRQSMEDFNRLPTTGHRYWMKVDFRGSDINEVIFSIGGYRSMTSVILCAIAMLIIPSSYHLDLVDIISRVVLSQPPKDLCDSTMKLLWTQSITSL